jgi:hypothetical protein
LCWASTGGGDRADDVAECDRSPSWRPDRAGGDDGAVLSLAGESRGVLVEVVRGAPTSPLYTILLMAHVLCAVVGFGSMAVTGVQAARARRGLSAPGAEGVRRYFRPGVNWAGRALYGVPVFGFCLIAASKGAFSSGDGFVVVGLLVWLVAVLLAEMLLWPGERRIQLELTERWGEQETATALDGDCRQVAGTAVVLAVLFVTATVIMIGKP